MTRWEQFVEALESARRITPDVAKRIKRDPNSQEANGVVALANGGAGEVGGYSYASVDRLEEFLRS